MVVRQGDVFMVAMPRPVGSEPGFRHPLVVVQNNVLNRSMIATTIVCAITSNLTRAAAPGNVVVAKGEGGLTKRSVVNVTQVFTLGKSRLTERVGALSPGLVRQILDGIRLVTEPREPPLEDAQAAEGTTR